MARTSIIALLTTDGADDDSCTTFFIYPPVRTGVETVVRTPVETAEGTVCTGVDSTGGRSNRGGKTGTVSTGVDITLGRLKRGLPVR